jgi:hypothetical protein
VGASQRGTSQAGTGGVFARAGRLLPSYSCDYRSCTVRTLRLPFGLHLLRAGKDVRVVKSTRTYILALVGVPGKLLALSLPVEVRCRLTLGAGLNGRQFAKHCWSLVGVFLLFEGGVFLFEVQLCNWPVRFLK